MNTPQVTMQQAADFILRIAQEDGEPAIVCIGGNGLGLALDNMAETGMAEQGGGEWQSLPGATAVTFWHGVDNGLPFVLGLGYRPGEDTETPLSVVLRAVKPPAFDPNPNADAEAFHAYLARGGTWEQWVADSEPWRLNAGKEGKV